jgi:hypothetical protein
VRNVVIRVGSLQGNLSDVRTKQAISCWTVY